MATLSATHIDVSTSPKINLFGLGEAALRLMLVAALPISATVFFIQSF
jgi:hypothetical protein